MWQKCFLKLKKKSRCVYHNFLSLTRTLGVVPTIFFLAPLCNPQSTRGAVFPQVSFSQPPYSNRNPHIGRCSRHCTEIPGRNEDEGNFRDKTSWRAILKSTYFLPDGIEDAYQKRESRERPANVESSDLFFYLH